ncbi:MAG: crossover junction endodeoxyribonuclease RuvC [Rhodothermales bacterium]
MIILGIDPGSRHTGYGVIHIEGARQRIVEYGELHLDATEDHSLRLKQIYDRLLKVIERCLPDVCAIEMPVYGRNPQSMLKLGRAQAAAMLAVLNRQIPVTQYTPKEVKKSVTGNGNASKEQVWYMVRAILEITEKDPSLGLDASDALAVALCHAHRLAHGISTHSHKDWTSFVRANPGRVIE